MSNPNETLIGGDSVAKQETTLAESPPTQFYRVIDAKELIARITDYLSKGGLFNPEMMEHDKVRNLLGDCREYLLRPVSVEDLQKGGDASCHENHTMTPVTAKSAYHGDGSATSSPVEQGNAAPTSNPKGAAQNMIAEIVEKAWIADADGRWMGKAAFFKSVTRACEEVALDAHTTMLEQSHRIGELERDLAAERENRKAEAEYFLGETKSIRQQLEQADKDKERLDWLEANAADAICDTVFDDGNHHWHIEHCKSLDEPSGMTVRAAIDAAMKK